METSKSLKSNIWKLALSEFCYDFGLVWAIYILFFQYIGFGYRDIGLYEAICSITIIATEMASGALADLIGRKISIALGNISMLAMALLLGLGQGGMWILILAGIFSGLDFSFRSGATTALLYDTLIELRREQEFLAISGRIRAIKLFSRMTGMILGSFLFGFHPRSPYWLWSIFLITSAGVILSVREPSLQPQKVNWTPIWNNMKGSIKFIFKSPVLLWITGFFLVADVFAESYWDIFSQPHLEMVGLSTEGIGIVFGVLTGISGIASYYIGAIEKKVGEKKMLYTVILVQCFIYLLMAFISEWYWLAILLVFFTINRNFVGLLEDNYRNRHIPSKMRAGVLSAASFLKNGLFGGWALIWIYGVVLSRFGYAPVLLFSAGLLFIIGIGLLLTRFVKK